jgi:hypothetical protein
LLNESIGKILPSPQTYRELKKAKNGAYTLANAVERYTEGILMIKQVKVLTVNVTG